MSEAYREAYETLLGRRLPDSSGSNTNVLTTCFHHDETSPSCSIDLATGLWFCHASHEGGTFAKAIEFVKKVSREDAIAETKKLGIEPDSRVEARKPTKILPDTFEERYVEALRSNPAKRNLAFTKFGWSEATLEFERIGWDKVNKRFTFPIRDADGDLVNFRMYDPDHQGSAKVINWKTGYGEARLWPLASLASDTIIITEGEKDCVLMNQMIRDNGAKMSAITGTGGAGTWSNKWNTLFTDKSVIVIFDRDDAGEEAARTVSKALIRITKELRVVTLDVVDPPGADITDYFMKHSKGWDDFIDLVESTNPMPKPRRGRPRASSEGEVALTPHLSEASHAEFVNKRSRIKVIISGKDLAPYIVPKQVKLSCTMSQGSLCQGCALAALAGNHTVDIQDDDPILLDFIGTSIDKVDSRIKADLNVNRKCKEVIVEQLDTYNIEETTVVPEMDFSDGTREYVSRTAYVVGESTYPNRVYVMDGVSMAHPKSQHAIHFVPHLIPASDNIDAFRMDDVKRDRLKIFNPSDDQSVLSKMQEIARDLSINVTMIYGREDLIEGLDLCYHTVLAFDFMEKPVAKAWGDILIIGDTRTGKTETAQALISHYRLGEMVSGESASFAGLVGGLRQESGKRWSINWGRMVLNDRRLLAVDEVSGISTEDIGKMSSIRSNGIAEMTKIVTQRTWARTRSVMLSNPRSSMTMSQYSYGVDAVRALIGRPEDIARFDFVMAVATNEVSLDTINAENHPVVRHVYTSDLCRMLLLWTWSRKPEHIKFTHEAVTASLEIATKHAEMYSSDGGVPLVEGGNHRLKIAKLAVAAACRTFSTDETGENVIVTPEHVEYVADFLERTYAKPSLDYEGWSKILLSKRQVSTDLIDHAREWVKDHPEAASMWLENTWLRVDDFVTALDLDSRDARAKALTPLLSYKMIERGRFGYRKTAPFIHLLKEMDLDALQTAPAKEMSVEQDDFPF